MSKKFFYFAFDLVKIVVISLAIIIPVRYFLIQPFYVQGSSMEPNFKNSEYLIIDEISYNFNDPRRGDVVVFEYPQNPREYFIKRIVALPGERIEFRDGDIYIYNNIYEHGVRLVEDYLSEDLETFHGSKDNEIIKLGQEEYYVLGDKRNSSRDSRTFGPIEEDEIIGKVLFRGWPINRIQFFNSIEYQLNE